MTLLGASGTPLPLPSGVAEAARGRSRLGFALAVTF
jgi:hypothetical protein